jgi:hypothetical protein
LSLHSFISGKIHHEEKLRLFDFFLHEEKNHSEEGKNEVEKCKSRIFWRRSLAHENKRAVKCYHPQNKHIQKKSLSFTSRIFCKPEEDSPLSGGSFPILVRFVLLRRSSSSKKKSCRHVLSNNKSELFGVPFFSERNPDENYIE